MEPCTLTVYPLSHVKLIYKLCQQLTDRIRIYTNPMSWMTNKKQAVEYMSEKIIVDFIAINSVYHYQS